jgi:hypothetical protein
MRRFVLALTVTFSFWAFPFNLFSPHAPVATFYGDSSGLSD